VDQCGVLDGCYEMRCTASFLRGQWRHCILAIPASRCSCQIVSDTADATSSALSVQQAVLSQFVHDGYHSVVLLVCVHGYISSPGPCSCQLLLKCYDTGNQGEFKRVHWGTFCITGSVLRTGWRVGTMVA
jgi:hypothetical protein